MSKQVSVDSDKIDVVALRHGMNELGFQSQVVEDPATQAMNNEESAMVYELSQRERDAERVETTQRLLDRFLADFRRTGDLVEVGKRVVSLAKYIGHGSVDNLSLSDLGDAFGQKKATVSARIKRECNQVVEAAGGCGDAKWQQGAAQRAVSADAQRGNDNRVKNIKKD